MKRLTLVLAASLALAACSAGGETTTNPTTGASTAATDAVAVTVKDFKILPADLEVTGTTVTLAVTNEGPTPHNVAIRDESGTILVTTKDLGTGKSETISAELEPGTYTTVCTLPGHESLGTIGTLTVSAP